MIEDKRRGLRGESTPAMEVRRGLVVRCVCVLLHGFLVWVVAVLTTHHSGEKLSAVSVGLQLRRGAPFSLFSLSSLRQPPPGTER